MRSKTSLLNKTLFAIDLKQKTLPIGVGLFIVFFVSILLPGMVGGEDEMATAVASLRALFLMTNPVLIALLCILVVIVQFAYVIVPVIVFLILDRSTPPKTFPPLLAPICFWVNCVLIKSFIPLL